MDYHKIEHAAHSKLSRIQLSEPMDIPNLRRAIQEAIVAAIKEYDKQRESEI